MAKSYFDVAIFFICFRESLEAAIIVSVLLSLVEQIVKGQGLHNDGAAAQAAIQDGSGDQEEGDAPMNQRRLLRKLRIHVILGSVIGLFIALAIGAAFIAVYYTEVRDLWSSSEEVWEGVFSIIACIMIWVMSLAMLKMDRARAKWAYKLSQVFDKRNKAHDTSGKASKYALLILPLVTVMREGLEAVVFIGGVSLGIEARSIPIACIVGLITGCAVGAVIYFSSMKMNLSYFLIFSTTFLLFVGAGLCSRAAGYFVIYVYNTGVGGDVGETGLGPGSFDVRGMVWHQMYGNPENNSSAWGIFNAIFGWTHNANLATILTYVFYWLATIVALIWMKYSEGRTKLFGKESPMARERRLRREAAVADAAGVTAPTAVDEKGSPQLVDGEDEKGSSNAEHERAEAGSKGETPGVIQREVPILGNQ